MHYRQHPFVLILPFAVGLIMAVFGLTLATATRRWEWLLLVVCALVLVAWHVVRWWTLQIHIEGRQVVIYSFSGFVTYERVVSLNAPGGVRLRQNVAGWLCNYGTLRIDVFGTPVHFKYIYPFGQLRRQIDGQ